jgi:hypothetical protein
VSFVTAVMPVARIQTAPPTPSSHNQIRCERVSPAPAGSCVGTGFASRSSLMDRFVRARPPVIDA